VSPYFISFCKFFFGLSQCSYNKIYGVWSCENPTTLRDDLKKSLNFTGFVMSDWGGTHSTSIREGLDIEMPAGDFMGDTLLQLVTNGTIDVSFVDDSIMRILVPMFQFGLFDNYRPDPSLTCTNNVTSVEHNDLARTLSAASTILLKNDAPLNATSPLLPLNLNDPSLTSIAVIGLADVNNAITHGGGSGAVDPSRVVSPLAGILAHVNGRVKVLYDDGTNLNRASALAASCSVAIVFVGASNGREGHDRTTLAVDFLLDDLVEHVSSHQPRVVVVVSAPGAVLVPWRNHVPALVLNLLGGQEVGSAIADVLFGQVNPSARLPITLPLTDNDQQFSISQFPVCSPLIFFFSF
jgi:beta-glucosidase